ncbi:MULTISPECIES: hypothetical protein [unclassified Microbacterium]|uniref:hypothetical protein n=1 Tax=unclassified Microbacterium TaxID=2609290 RepID=UPI0034679685
MLDHTSSDIASTIREHIVDRKVSNSRTVDPTDPTLLEPVACGQGDKGAGSGVLDPIDRAIDGDAAESRGGQSFCPPEAHLRRRRSFRDVGRTCPAAPVSADCRELVDADIRRLMVASMSAIAGADQRQTVFVGFENLDAA